MENAEFIGASEDACRLLWVAGIVVAEYVLVLAATLADLASGIHKAKQRGEPARSRGLRRTVDKLARYYNVLAVLTVVDAMQIIGILYLRTVEGYDLPTFPIMTLLGALGMAFIEVKSIFEHGDSKEKERVSELAALLESLASSHKLKELAEFLKTKK